ncbi:UbiA family prenyltransferase [uncultured Methanobrevibacter sp.]|uniref:UbiA family prenyltransferase n=1 Tax=uncultured Methanobrevibacter sp. TaxID=253161 RepID=UPI0026356B85|nr:UbiA family prenyltransferase [uncultured Methanobrevibacter sp.]
MNPYVEIIRPGNVIMAIIAVVLVAILKKSIDIPIILAMLSVFFAMSGGNVINDYFDYKIDLINKPQRPIPSGRISLNKAKKYAEFLFIIAAIIGFIISYLVNTWIPCAIVLFADIILYLYAYKLKSTPLIGNLTVGFMTGLCFIFAGYSFNDPSIIYKSYLLAFFALIMTTAREITKDIEDIEGDKSEGAKTFPILYGTKISAIIAVSLIIIDCALCPILYIYHIFNLNYLIIVSIAALIFIYGAILLRNQDSKTANKVSKYLKIGMLIAFVAFALGTMTISI